MDFGDQGSQVTEAMTADMVARARSAAAVKRFPEIGKCYNCERPITGRNFCDTECRDEYEEFRNKIK